MKAATAEIIIPPQTPLVLIVGPTAVGKSEVAVALAERFAGEVVNGDSMQLYRDLSVGTCKPSAALCQRVPHHLYDLVAPGEPMDAMQYASAARRVIAAIVARRRHAFVVGGSGLYHRALVQGFCDTAAVGPAVREMIAEQQRRSGLAALFQRLQQVDAVAAERLSANDGVRIRRALEVFEATGRPLSELHREHRAASSVSPFRVLKLGLQLDRQQLYQRINQRAERLFAGGIVEEVVHFEPGRERGIGYAEARAVRDGDLTEEAAIRRVAQRTRNYAKRQLTWFRRDPEVVWFEAGASGTIERMADTLQRFFAAEAPTP